MERTQSANRVPTLRNPAGSKSECIGCGKCRQRARAAWVIAILYFVAVFSQTGFSQTGFGQAAETEERLDHQQWDAMVQEYATPKGRVDYARWQDNDMARLDGYLGQLEEPWPSSLSDSERKAGKINACNALTVRWILQHYPVKSIWDTSNPFTDLWRRRTN